MDLKEGCVNWFWQTGLPLLEGDSGFSLRKKKSHFVPAVSEQFCCNSAFLRNWKNPNIQTIQLNKTSCSVFQYKIYSLWFWERYITLVIFIAYCIASSYCMNLCCDTSTSKCIRHTGNTYDTINPNYVNSSLMRHEAFPPIGLEPFCCNYTSARQPQAAPCHMFLDLGISRRG